MPPRFLRHSPTPAHNSVERARPPSAVGTVTVTPSTAAVTTGRSPDEIEYAGYILCLADESRRAALNRAKREPFVIYMMSILSDVSLKRAGFPRDLRDQIAHRASVQAIL